MRGKFHHSSFENILTSNKHILKDTYKKSTNIQKYLAIYYTYFFNVCKYQQNKKFVHVGGIEKYHSFQIYTFFEIFTMI